MSIQLIDNLITADDYLAFQKKMGWPMDPRAQIERSLANQLFSVAAVRAGEIIGMGRLLGDAAIYWYINDVFLLTAYQRQGIGTQLVRRLVTYATENSLPGTSISICLMCAKGKEPFYERLGFVTRPHAREGAGMEMEVDVPRLA